MKRLARPMRKFEVALALAALVAAFAVGAASGADFDGDNGPCHETPGDAALLRCPTAYVGSPYQVKIAIEEDSGCYPYVWFEIVNSSLPGGLSMSRDGVISGIPTGAGLSRFWVWNHDLTAAEGGPSWCTFDDPSQREFSIPVDPGLAIVNTAVKPGTVGQAYSDTLTARELTTLNPPAGPNVTATWSLQSGALPPGVTLTAGGALSGTPTAEGSYPFVVKAQAGALSQTQTFTLVVRQPVVVSSPFAAATRKAEVGIPLAVTATAKGGTGTYTWTLSAGSLPAGLAFDAASGTIAGRPRAAGRFAFALTAADTEGRTATANVSLTVAPKLAIKTLRLKSAKRARLYEAKLATVGGVEPVKWKVLRGRLPLGVRLAKSIGTLVGIPRRAGSFPIVLEARDALGARAQTRLLLVVKR